MNSKQAKKIRKETRKSFKANFGEGMEVLQMITRKRPKWCPKRIWVLLYIPLFPRKYIKVLYKHIV